MAQDVAVNAGGGSFAGKEFKKSVPLRKERPTSTLQLVSRHSVVTSMKVQRTILVDTAAN
jgi:hypothetical protein